MPKELTEHERLLREKRKRRRRERIDRLLEQGVDPELLRVLMSGDSLGVIEKRHAEGRLPSPRVLAELCLRIGGPDVGYTAHVIESRIERILESKPRPETRHRTIFITISVVSQEAVMPWHTKVAYGRRRDIQTRRVFDHARWHELTAMQRYPIELMKEALQAIRPSALPECDRHRLIAVMDEALEDIMEPGARDRVY